MRVSKKKRISRLIKKVSKGAIKISVNGWAIKRKNDCLIRRKKVKVVYKI